MVNRGAEILRYKASFVKWIQEADPADPSGQKMELTIEQANRESYSFPFGDDKAGIIIQAEAVNINIDKVVTTVSFVR